MLRTEDVISWFKDAQSYHRIEVMCTLLNMCLPFEIRFLGSCIEDKGKQDYQELRGADLIANDVERLAKELIHPKGLLDQCQRHRLTVFVSLLSSRNFSCANWIYSMILRTESLNNYFSDNFHKDSTLHNELLLLFTLLINHPAFNFEQKQYFSDIVTRLFELDISELSSSATSYPSDPGNSTNTPIQVQQKASVSNTPVVDGVINEPPMVPPGLPLPCVQKDFMPPQNTWPPRAAFINTINTSCPPPTLDLSSFPPPLSPMVSQQTSPVASRSVSPTRMYPCRSQIPLLQHIERMPPPPPPYNADNNTVPLEEVHCDAINDKNSQWLEPGLIIGGKIANGLLPGMPVPPKCQTIFLSNEMQALSLDAEPSLVCISSGSSTSEGKSPPDTPTECAIAPHGPGRGDSKVPSSTINAGVPLPSLATGEIYANTGTVPYSNQQFPPPPTNFHNRSIYYSQAYRHQYPTYQQNGEIPYMFQYMPLINFNAPPPPQPIKISCYNCGALGHLGSECKNPTIEEITQKKSYQLDYSSVTPPPPTPETHPSTEKQ